MAQIIKTDEKLQEICILKFEGDSAYENAANWLDLSAKAFGWTFKRVRGQLFNGYYVDATGNSYELK